MLKPPFYIISDTHFYHNNIVNFCHRPKEHNKLMVGRWQNAIGDDDTVLHLGDVFMGRDADRKFRWGVSKWLPGKKYLILGNHDKPHFEWDKYGFEVIEDYYSFNYRDHKVTFSHYPSEEAHYYDGNWLHVHGHIHNNGYEYDHGVSVLRNNINVSVEVIDYTPQPIYSLLDKVIDSRLQVA